jgi:hypothetical protein
MTHRIVWNGTQQEALLLVNILSSNCACKFGVMGARRVVCAPHRMLTEDQRALDGLLFARHVADRFRTEEFSLADERSVVRDLEDAGV